VCLKNITKILSKKLGKQPNHDPIFALLRAENKQLKESFEQDNFWFGGKQPEH